MPEVIVFVTRREFEQAVVQVLIRIAHGKVAVTNVRRRDGESHQSMLAKRRLIDDEVGQRRPCSLDRRTEQKRGHQHPKGRQADGRSRCHGHECLQRTSGR